MMQTHFPPEERLAILKASDSARKWYSLDDKRVCAICDRVFTGRQIDIQSDPKRRYFLACPTPTCPSNISHWLPPRSLPGLVIKRASNEEATRNRESRPTSTNRRSGDLTAKCA